MATTLSFNPTRIRTPTFNYSNHPFITKLIASSKPTTIRIPCNNNAIRNNPRQLLHFRTSSVSESSVSTTQKEDEEDDENKDDPTAETCYLDPETEPEGITEWELDFCSRPILDARGKKLWELVVCDKSLSLQYTKYFPNNVINSITLKDAIVTICDELALPFPRSIRFFR